MLSAGPDVGTAQNASQLASGGAGGSERSACWAKTGNGAPTTTSTITSNKPGYIDIELTKTNGNGNDASAPFAFSARNGQIATVINGTNTQESLIRANYPPSPPATASNPASQMLAAKPLTIANVATIQATGSPFSPLSTSPSSDDAASESSSENQSSASELSFSSAGSHAALASLVPTTKESDAFLASVFGESHMNDFNELGVQVTVPPADALEGEDVQEPVFQGAAILGVPALGTKTLYLAPHVERLDREGLVDLFEIADEDLGCSGIVICLDKRQSSSGDKTSTAALAETLHALMYVGGSIVPPDAGIVKYNSEDYILVGLEL